MKQLEITNSDTHIKKLAISVIEPAKAVEDIEVLFTSTSQQTDSSSPPYIGPEEVNLDFKKKIEVQNKVINHLKSQLIDKPLVIGKDLTNSLF